MNYLTSALLAAVSFGFYNFFVGKAGNKITPFVATILLSVTGALVAILVTLIVKYTGGKITVSPEGIKFAILAGLTAGIAEIFYFLTFTKNPSITTVLPIVFTVTVVTGVILGLLFNNESLSTCKFFGMGLSLLALYLLTKWK